MSLYIWLGQVLELFSEILAAVFSIPVLALFASVLLFLVVVGLLAALIRQRGI